MEEGTHELGETDLTRTETLSMIFKNQKEGKMEHKKFARMWGMVVLAVILMASITAQATTTLKVGSTEPFQTAMGIEAKKCLEILVDEFNKAGGIKIKGETYKIKMTIYDDKYKPDVGRSAVERLVYQDKVKFMVGQLGSAGIIGGIPVIEENKILTWVGGVNEKIIDPKNRYTIRHAGVGGTNWIYLRKKYPNVKTMAVFTVDDLTGHWNAKTQGEMAKSYGLKVMKPVFYPRPTKDFAPFATKIKSMNPDVIATWGAAAGTQLGLMYKALYEAGWRGVKTMSVFKTDEVLSVSPKAALEGLMVSISDPTMVPNPTSSVMKLKKAYIEKYGKWDFTGVDWTNPWFSFIAALKKANSLDPEDIKAAMKGLEFEGTHGMMTMMKRPDKGNNRYCDVLRVYHMFEVKDGKLVYAETTSQPDAKNFIEKVYGHKGEWGF